jgi:cobalt-zinc-cadmium efflux system membrane fusion protein
MKYKLILAAIALAILACTNHEQAPPAANFVLTKTLAESKELATADSQTVENEVALTGKITFNENMVARVFPLAGGFVLELNAEIGDFVKKGEVLAVIRSPEIAGFIQDSQAAQSRLQVAKKNAAVTEELYKSGQASQVQLNNDQNELQRAEGELKRANEVVELYGARPNSTYAIKSPISGYVIQKNIALNMELRTEDISPVFIVGSMDEVWAMANVYESDISKIKVGYDAYITTISYPDRVYKGKIDKIFNIMDSESRVLKARITLENKDIQLKPEMFAKVIVRYATEETKIVIPSKAIIFDKSKYFVMVYRADNDIETREIEIFKQYNDITYLKQGVKAGEKVMTRYQLLVYDAMND